jgi:hypothetical protein
MNLSERILAAVDDKETTAVFNALLNAFVHIMAERQCASCRKATTTTLKLYIPRMLAHADELAAELGAADEAADMETRH